MSLRLFWNFNIFVFTLFIYVNRIKCTYDKLETVKLGFSILDMFSQVLSNVFTFFINTTNQEIQNILEMLEGIQHSNPAYLRNVQTNKQTNRQQL